MAVNSGLPVGVEVVTVRELATVARVSVMTIYRLIDSGDLRVIRLGERTYRIPMEAALEFMEGSTDV